MVAAVAALTVICLALLWERRAERIAFAKERQDLLQRVQSPETAVALHAKRELPEGPLYVPVGDDAAFWEDRNSA